MPLSNSEISSVRAAAMRVVDLIDRVKTRPQSTVRSFLQWSSEFAAACQQLQAELPLHPAHNDLGKLLADSRRADEGLIACAVRVIDLLQNQHSLNT